MKLIAIWCPSLTLCLFYTVYANPGSLGQTIPVRPTFYFVYRLCRPYAQLLLRIDIFYFNFNLYIYTYIYTYSRGLSLSIIQISQYLGSKTTTLFVKIFARLNFREGLKNGFLISRIRNF